MRRASREHLPRDRSPMPPFDRATIALPRWVQIRRSVPSSSGNGGNRRATTPPGGRSAKVPKLSETPAGRSHRRGTSQPGRTVQIGQIVRIVEPVTCPAETNHEIVRGEGHNTFVRMIVLKVVVVIRNEENRHRPTKRAIKVCDLRSDRFLQNIFVRGPENGLRSVKNSRQSFCLLRGSNDLGTPAGQLIPVEMITDGDQRVRAEGQSALQQPGPLRQGEKIR